MRTYNAASQNGTVFISESKMQSCIAHYRSRIPNFVFSVLALLLMAAPVQDALGADAQPTVSPNVAAFLIPGQEAYQRQNFLRAIDQARQAQRQHGITPYDRYLIDELLGASLLGEKNYAGAAVALERSSQSPYFDPARSRQMAEMLTRIYHESKNYSKAAWWGEEAIRQGVINEDIYVITGLALNSMKDYSRARSVLLEPVREMVRNGPEPSAQLLTLLAFTCRHAGDQDCISEFGGRVNAQGKSTQ